MYKSIYLSDRFSFYRCDFAELTSKQTFTYSKSTIKTLEKGVKYVLRLTIKKPDQRQ